MYKVDIENKNLIKLEHTTFFLKKLKERYDIQEWVEKNPEIIEENLLIIGKEVPLPSDIRIDLVKKEKKQKEIRQTKSSSFSLEKSNYDSEKLKKELISSLTIKSDLTPRIIAFLDIIIQEHRTYDRKEVKEKLFEYGIGDDIGQADI